MSVRLRVEYASLGALAHDLRSQLAVGGLFVPIAAPAGTQPLETLTLEIRIDGGPSLDVPARLTVANESAACVEIPADARAALVESLERIVAGALPDASGARTARFLTEQDATTPPEPREPPRPPSQPMSLDRRIAAMSVGEKIQLALHGDREARALLIRDRAPPVHTALVRNPKLTLDELLALARAPHLGGDTADSIAAHPSFGSSPQVAFALVKNPRTPLPIATQLVARLQPADLRAVAKGLGVRAQVAQAARKKLFNLG